ncbi:hypothetical protein [Erythrobacter aureus]|uniref:Uncharacterized protein n=1 Tax=Erythrobacter aureus TaxID=2182384 RepID=A0A345YIP8_9SPHN|nr:hypothetical protein [Erythrobacter aureus]AXK43800.1 hypothetical protein DVR09_15195 [Erythrobacter aureus]
MAFADHYSLIDFTAIADAAWWRTGDFDRVADDLERYNAAAEADKADRARLADHKVKLKAALTGHLEDLRTAGALGAASGLGGRDIPIAEAWNTFVTDGQIPRTFDWLLEALENVWSAIFVRMDQDRWARRKSEDHIPGSHQPPSGDAIRTAYERICRTYDTGTSFSEEGPLNDWRIEANDRISGDRCELNFVAWKAMLTKRDDDYKPVLVEDIAPMGVVTASFDMPTGKMLLTDILRLKSFDEGTSFDANREYGELSLGNALGRNNLVAAHASEHQIAFTQTDNTSVAILRDAAGRLLITERFSEEHQDDDGDLAVPGWEVVGSFSCDVWRFMAFDRESVLARMTAGGAEDAAAELDSYLAKADTLPDPSDHQAHHDACYAANIVHLEVEPGQWQIHGGENFDDLADREALNLPQDLHLWCLLEKQAA